MNIDAHVEAWASLHLIPGVGHRALFALLKAVGGPEEVLAASGASLSAIVGSALAGTLGRGADPASLARTLEWIAEDGHALVALDDPLYPQALLESGDAPPVFYYAGNSDLLKRTAFAIVGSRNATPQGAETAEAFAAALSDAGLTIVSGLALGIDGAAHRGGLSGRSGSIAVIATGADRVYPASHRDLAHRLAQDGGMLSEFPLGTAPMPSHFPRRNRIISGLSRGVLVVEATLKSGSLITARLAAEQGREVFAIPGSIHSPFSKGCHRLIKEGAKLVETAADILDELHPGARATVPRAPPAAPLRSDLARLLEALGYDPATLEALCERTGLAPDVVTGSLVELELAGRVAMLPGGTFQRLR